MHNNNWPPFWKWQDLNSDKNWWEWNFLSQRTTGRRMMGRDEDWESQEPLTRSCTLPCRKLILPNILQAYRPPKEGSLQAETIRTSRGFNFQIKTTYRNVQFFIESQILGSSAMSEPIFNIFLRDFEIYATFLALQPTILIFKNVGKIVLPNCRHPRQPSEGIFVIWSEMTAWEQNISTYQTTQQKKKISVKST